MGVVVLNGAAQELNAIDHLRADFFAVVGNLASRELVRQCVAAFPSQPDVRCKGIALPGRLPGVKSSAPGPSGGTAARL